MNDANRYRLHFGPYETPRFYVGDLLHCEIRGEVVAVGLTGGRIPWPVGKSGRHKAIVVYAALAAAIRRESAQAVAHWWGVRPLHVWVWRKALGVGATTEGTSRLRRVLAEEPAAVEGLKKGQAKSGDPERRAKVAAARKGKPRPPHVVEAMRAGRTGKPQSEETRRKIGEAMRRLGVRPPKAGRPWSEEENELVRTLSIEEAAVRTGRSEGAVEAQRRLLRRGG